MCVCMYVYVYVYIYIYIYSCTFTEVARFWRLRRLACPRAGVSNHRGAQVATNDSIN